MLEFLNNLDEKLFLLLNSLSAPWLDPVMFALTDARYWIPFFLIIMVSLVYKFKWQTVSILLFLTIAIICADQLSASLLKPWIGRLRPSHNPELKNLIHTVNGYRGGQFGFVSSHATNAFAIATFIWLSARKKVSWIWIMFIWAIIFSYTRIYLGVHYPGDIVFGALLGASIGWLMYQLMKRASLPNKISYQG